MSTPIVKTQLQRWQYLSGLRCLEARGSVDICQSNASDDLVSMCYLFRVFKDTLNGIAASTPEHANVLTTLKETDTEEAGLRSMEDLQSTIHNTRTALLRCQISCTYTSSGSD